MERTVRELQGISCIDIEDIPPDKKEIASARSFGHVITSKADLTEAVTDFAARASEELRRQSALAGQVHVFIRTSPFRKDNPQDSRSVTLPLCRPSCDTIKIAGAAVLGLGAIYKPEFRYAKAGGMLLDMQPDSVIQSELDLDDDPKDAGKLMTAMDVLNRRYGKGTVIIGSSGTAGAKRVWSMTQERRTPEYTTRGEDMPRVRA